MQVCCTVPEGQ